MSTTVLAPLAGRVLPLADVPDPIFAQAMVGHGAAVDPVHDVLDVVAPIGGTVVKAHPHAFVILGADGVGVLVHLGIDTVQLDGAGFTRLVTEGDVVVAGDPVVIYDVPSVVAAGRSPVVPVVVMEKGEDALSLLAELGGDVVPGAPLLSVTA